MIEQEYFYNFSLLSVALMIIAGIFNAWSEKILERNNEQTYPWYLSQSFFKTLGCCWLISSYLAFAFSIVSFDKYNSLGLGRALDNLYTALAIPFWGIPYLTGSLLVLLLSFPICTIVCFDSFISHYRNSKLVNSINLNIAELGYYIDDQFLLSSDSEPSKHEFSMPGRFGRNIREELSETFGISFFMVILSWFGALFNIVILFLFVKSFITSKRYTSEEASFMALANQSLDRNLKLNMLLKFAKKENTLDKVA